MNESKFDSSRWAGKTAEEVLSQSYHEIRDPVLKLAGYLNVLKSVDLNDEQARHIVEKALAYSLSAKEIVESVYAYMNEKWANQ